MADEPTYTQALKIGWAVLWRCVGSFLGVLFGLNLFVFWMMPELMRTEPSIWMAVLPLGVAALLCLIGIMPFVIRSILHTRYGPFRLRLVRESESREEEVTKPEKVGAG